MTTAQNESGRKHVIITDLDLSDCHQQMESKYSQDLNRKAHKKRHAQKQLHTISGNFSRRSRSAEHRSEDHNASRVNSYFNELLQSKDKQMDTLLQRLATLHKFNEQFDAQNKELRLHVHNLEERIDSLQHEIANCGRCQELSQQLSKCSTEKQTLISDVAMMKTLVYRLNVQIERYQDRLRVSKNGMPIVTNMKSNSDKNGTGDVPNQNFSITAWEECALHTHTLSPLLQSYDEMIRDKEQLIQQYMEEFEHFTGELKRTLEENNSLLQQNESLRREVGSWREERTRLQAKADVCRAKAEAQTRKCDLAKEKLVEVMHCYEQKMQSLVLDMEHLQSAYTRCKNELASLKSVAKQSPDNMAHALQECKALSEELKSEYSSEKKILENTIEELRVRHAEDSNKIAELKTERKTLEKELEQMHAAAEDLQMRTASFQRTAEKIKRSRDRLKARLRIALQWAQKIEEGQANIQNTWDALKRLETIVKHKESQVRGLHARHLQEIDKMQRKLFQKEETIRNILKGKLGVTEQAQ